MIKSIERWHRVLQQQRHRGVVILGGETHWCYQQLQTLIQHHAGDWIALQHNIQRPVAVKLVAQPKQLLGESYRHGIVDLQQGFDVIGLAMLAGTLVGGSLLVLIVPPWDTWSVQPDHSIIQWGEAAQPCATPNFIRVVQRVLSRNSQWLGWWQEGKNVEPRVVISPASLPDLSSGELTTEQQQIYQQIRQASAGFWVLTAARGRGKSLLAGRLAQFWQQQPAGCWVTALQKSSAALLLAQTNYSVSFFAPEDLLEELNCIKKNSESMPWIIVEEAATLPLPFLQQLVQQAPKVLFVTTLQGYEGSGQGFLIKFLKLLPEAKLLRLAAPIRWAADDPLEQLLNQLLLLDEGSATKLPQNASNDLASLALIAVNQQQLAASDEMLKGLYQLLTQTHYRTSPLDLRRLLDAPYAFLLMIQHPKEGIVAGCWSLNEGEIEPDLQRAIFVGTRRPRGNLVPQTLLAHGQLNFASLPSIRITRLAVQSAYRRQGVATQLVNALLTQARLQQKGYVSACFGYNETLAAFWQQCGFKLVHLGTQRETKSGCYSAIFIYPISLLAQSLVERAQRQLQEDWYWLQQIIALPLAIETLAVTPQLQMRDWNTLVAFALGQRAIHGCYPNLMRLSLVCPKLDITTIYALCHHSLKQQRLPLGRKTHLTQLREQVKCLLIELDPAGWQASKKRLVAAAIQEWLDYF